MKLTPLLVALALHAAPLHAQPAARATNSLAPAEMASLETVRRNVWVHWFSGDTANLRHVLGPELVAMSADDRHWQTRDQTIAQSAEFAKGGGRFVSVSFDSTAAHHVNGTVVMFARYTVVTERAGKRTTQRGRASEVFVKTNAGWVHTSWHLDRDR